MNNQAKLNKADNYQNKIQEREEFEIMNMYNPFGRQGNGAPITDNSGNSITRLRSFEKEQPVTNFHFENTTRNVSNQSNQPGEIYYNKSGLPYNFSNQYSPYDGYNNANSQNGYSYNYPNNQRPISNYNVGYAPSRTQNALTSYNINYQTEIPLSNMNKTPLSPLENRNYTNINPNTNQALLNPNINTQLINKTMINDDSKFGVLPTEKVNMNKEARILSYQNELKMQIEEKKKKDEDRRRKQKELDYLDEEKYRQYLVKKKDQDEQQKRKKKTRNTVKEDGKEEREETKQENILDFRDPQPTPYKIMSPPIEDDIKDQEGNELFSFKEMIGINIENMKKDIKADTGRQLDMLKSEVSKQYSELNEIFHKLRMDVREASQFKFEADRVFNQIKEQIEKKRQTNILYEEKLTRVLERHSPYNNLHIPYKDVNPVPPRKRHLNLQSTSALVYDRDDITDEKNNYRLSSLAQRGQELIGISDFVPINKNNETTIERQIESRENNDKYEYPELYSNLDEITKLNTKLNPGSKLPSLTKDYEWEMKNNKKQKENLYQLDEFLQGVIEKDQNINKKNGDNFLQDESEI